MKLIYVLIIVPLILIAIIVLQKIFIQESIGPFSTLAISALLFLSLLVFLSLLLYQRKKWQTVQNLWLAVVSSIVTYAVIDMGAGYLLIEPLSALI